MSRRVLVDTGPLVALVNRRDAWHDWARNAVDSMPPPLATCEAVISEACFLLARVRGGAAAVLGMVEAGHLVVPWVAAREAASLRALMVKYADVPMAFADACLVRMSELDPRAAVMTVERDFFRYRRHGRAAIPLITPYQA